MRKKAEGSRVKRPCVPAEPTHSGDGVDLTLIRWMLSLTPAERLQVLQAKVASILSLRTLVHRDGDRPV